VLHALLGGAVAVCVVPRRSAAYNDADDGDEGAGCTSAATLTA
jgi:hypothetical protein